MSSKPIVVGTDGSEEALYAVEWAARGAELGAGEREPCPQLPATRPPRSARLCA